MSSTERLLEVGSTAGRIMKRDPIGYAPFAQVIYGVDNAEMDDSAKRLAASWNLCQGVPTDDLESGKVVVLPVATAMFVYGQLGADIKRWENARKEYEEAPNQRYVEQVDELYLKPLREHQNKVGEAIDRLQQKPNDADLPTCDDVLRAIQESGGVIDARRKRDGEPHA